MSRPTAALPPAPYEGDPEALIKLCFDTASVEECRALIARGIDIDRQDKDQDTALMRAAINGRTEVVQELVRAGAALDLQDKDQFTALMWAARRGRTEAVQELVRAGAALDLQDNEGKTALQQARDWNHHRAVAILRHRDPDATPTATLTATPTTSRCVCS